MPITIEETNPNKYGFDGKLSLGKVASPSQKKSKEGKKTKDDPKKFDYRSDGKLSLGKVAYPTQKKFEATKLEEDPQNVDYWVGEKGALTRAAKNTKKVVSCWITLGLEEDDEHLIGSDGKLSLGEIVSPSKKKFEATKLEEDPQNVDYRIGEKGPLTRASKKVDSHFITFGDGEDGEPLIRPVEEADGVIVLGIIDKHEMAKAKECKEDVDNLLFRFEEMRIKSQEYAIAAMSYLRKKGHNLELVKPGMHEAGDVNRGIRIHCNFKAKRTDCPDSPVEEYFAQLCQRCSSDLVVECCVSLGESASLPYARDNRGCQYCTEFVHHPVDRPREMKLGVVTWCEEKETFIVT